MIEAEVSLFLAPSFGLPGQGDAIAMRYQHALAVNILASVTFKDTTVIAEPNAEQASRIAHWAVNVPPPSAPNQAAVEENCQGWIIRVVRHLVEEGIVEDNRLTYIESLKEKIG